MSKWLEQEVFYNTESPIIETWQSARCSKCGKYLTTPYTYYFTHYQYCPYCGERMLKDGETNDVLYDE